MTYAIVHKPTFTNQLLAVPANEIPNILKKVQLLQDAPQPDAKNKKRLVGYQGAVYRIRSGDFRILYTFDQERSIVTLLGVDLRKDVYEGEQLIAEEVHFSAGEVPDIGDLLGPARPVPTEPAKRAFRDAADDLPVKLTPDFLQQLRIPDAHIGALSRCKTIDHLIETDVPDVVRERIFAIVTSPDLDRVLQQPTFITGGVDDLLKFHQGELLEFLLQLDSDQQRYVTWAVSGRGPTLVKGGPGSGKSTIALYRVKALIERLRARGEERPSILFTTYTHALVQSSQQLLRRLLGDDAALVEVRTADSLAYALFSSDRGKPSPVPEDQLLDALQVALKKVDLGGNPLQQRVQRKIFDKLSTDYLLSEINGVIVARDLQTLGDYLEAPRAGRRMPLNASQRTAIWRLHETLSKELERRGLQTWEGIRAGAARVVQEGKTKKRYDGVIIDEAQDLNPTALRMLLGLAVSPDRLFCTADANQSIYGSGFRWVDVHSDLRFQGRTGVLRHNHRSTRQIGEAANDYLYGATLDEVERPTYRQTGPNPAVRVVTTAEEEAALIARFVEGASREFHLGLGANAVLVPSKRNGEPLAQRLRDLGVDALFMEGRALDLESPAVKVLTCASAKGLEFPIATVAGFVEGQLHGAPDGASSEEAEEALLRMKRTLFVAMTRAMRGLLVVAPARHPFPLFEGFDRQFWNVG